MRRLLCLIALVAAFVAVAAAPFDLRVREVVLARPLGVALHRADAGDAQVDLLEVGQVLARQRDALALGGSGPSPLELRRSPGAQAAHGGRTGAAQCFCFRCGENDFSGCC